MSEVTDLKKKILSKLDGMSNRHQLRLIHKIMDRLDVVEQCLKQNEPSLTRGGDASFFKNEIDFDNLPSESEGDEDHLKGLVNQAVTLLADMEKQLS